RSAVMDTLMAGYFDHAPVRGEVALQDDEPAGRLEWVVERPYHRLAGGFLRLRRLLRDRATRDRRKVARDEPTVEQSLEDEGTRCRLVQVGRDVAPARLHVREQGGLRGVAVEVVDREIGTRLLRHRDQVEDRVRGAAGGRDHGGGHAE